MQFGKVHLRKGRDKAARNHHPWIFSGAIDKVEPGEGLLYQVISSGGEVLGQAYYNRQSQIAGRMLSFDASAKLLERDYWSAHFRKLCEQREMWFAGSDTDSYRLCFSEADAVPGLIVEKFGPGLLVQFLTKGIHQLADLLLDALEEVFAPEWIIGKIDEKAAKLEDFAPVQGLLRGKEPEATIEISQDGLRYRVDLGSGQKTGFYFDQRENRLLCRELAKGKTVLDCFTYSGGFSINALRGGATEVLSVDSSEPALELTRINVSLNDGTSGTHRSVCADAFSFLRQEVADGKLYDLVILDPPKFAQSGAHVNRAARAYKDVNRLGMQLVRPGGMLMSFSCSGHVSADLFQKILFSASEEAGRQGQLLRPLFQAADHPVRLSVPETLYLKGFLCRIL